MPKSINIPALNGAIDVDLSVAFAEVGKQRVIGFPDDADPYDSSLKLPGGDWKNTPLKVEAMLHFPPKDEKGKQAPKNMYSQHV
jgi:hypothetical protein